MEAVSATDRSIMGGDNVATSLSLMRRLPPAKIEQNLSGLLNLVPEDQEELLQRIDQPLEVASDADGKKYLLSDYNRDGDSHRSPWNNKYDPPVSDGFVPTASLREMEVEANLLFDTYRELYFDGGHSSVYFWDLEGSGFAACFLIKKVTEGGDTVKMGSWDGIHVIEVTEKAGSSPKQFVYKLTSTVMLNTNIENSESGKTTLAGSVTRQAEKTTGIEGENSHVANMGSMVEDMETDMRQHLLAITYVQKMGDILRETRNVSENASDEDKSALNKIAESMNAAALGAKVAGIAKEA